MEWNDPIIDQFLDQMPLEPLPANFVQKTMRRAILEKHFRLRFIDFALPAFLICFLPVVAGVVWWMLQLIDPLWLAQMKLQIQFQWLTLPQPAKMTLLAVLPTVGFFMLAAVLTGIIFITQRRETYR